MIEGPSIRTTTQIQRRKNYQVTHLRAW